jgi:hypothetical protein
MRKDLLGSTHAFRLQKQMQLTSVERDVLIFAHVSQQYQVDEYSSAKLATKTNSTNVFLISQPTQGSSSSSSTEYQHTLDVTCKMLSLYTYYVPVLFS